ncbi:peptidase S41 family protein [Thelonectria olida]|uniref:Peptidase S41 family protein n=1 Tax=Thelonectria olida TaxID=1576542 RepID=A0A9P8W2Z1_9HYPO|nr:peptidase S41 family protein [Thelonectria olida]
MVLFRYLTLLCVFFGLAATGPTPAKPARVTRKATLTERDDADPPSTICGDIIDYVNNGTTVFYASDAYECLISVPFNQAVALRFLEYYNTTILFQSTLAYLRAPPEGYQQPAIDVLQELDVIKRNITDNVYPNEYAFEVALQSVVYRVHDAHVELNSGILAAFAFASPVDLMTASKDGKEIPKVYFKDDILALQEGDVDISPVVSINGIDVDDFLTDLAALQSVGMLEPHADWNELMSNPARDIQYELSILGGGLTFYPGDELNFTFANGTTYETWWLAIYSEPYFTGPLRTGGDFYNYFVLGLLPASYDEVPLPDAFNYSQYTSEINLDDSTESQLLPYTISHAYPKKPDVVQQGISDQSTGFVTGYFLNDTKTGVLSIPTFNQIEWDVGNFSLAVANFISRAKDAKLEKIIIDLQQNAGGMVEPAFVTFGQFFPEQEPFAGSRRRSHELANSIGKAYNEYWKRLPFGDEKIYYEASEWVVLPRLNADTGRNFTSWAEYYGPRNFHDDDFSLTERYDLANEVWDAANFDGWVPTKYTEGSDSTRPWDPKNIVLLTDGACSSTCSLFTEMMVQAGVRTVVVGGRPASGPMQATAGTRGASPYLSLGLDNDFNTARNWSTDAAAALPEVRDPGVFINYATFNLRDQIRKDDDTGTPLQFKYLPADCRLYFTLDNVFNMSALWRDVGHATWTDSSLCVAGSTTANSTSPPDGSKSRAVTPDLGLHNSRNSLDMPDPLTDGETEVTRPNKLKFCDPESGSSTCPPHVGCEPVRVKCDGKPKRVHICVMPCTNSRGCLDPLDQSCKLFAPTESSMSTSGISKGRPVRGLSNDVRKGICVPKSGSDAICKDAKAAS